MFSKIHYRRKLFRVAIENPGTKFRGCICRLIDLICDFNVFLLVLRTQTNSPRVCLLVFSPFRILRIGYFRLSPSFLNVPER